MTVTATDPIASGVTAWDLVQTFTVAVAPSVLILDPTAGGALSLSGNASLKIPGAIVVDSSSSSAVSASGNAAVKAAVIDVHGKVQKSGNASFSPTPTTGAPVTSDPLGSLAEPSTSGLTNQGSVSLSGNASRTIPQGVYSSISVSGNASLTLGGGTYIIEGGGLSVSGNARISGTGVLIVNAGSKYPSSGGTYGSISLSGNGSYSLTPMTTGTYAGIVIFQTRDNSKALTISGNALGMTGTVYAPAAPLAESGNAALNAALIVDTLSISGNGVANTVTLNSPTGTVAYTPAQIRAAYGISSLSLDGTGQTIAIVDAYDDPAIFQALDAFDQQFGLTASGPTLYAQYGPASSFLTVVNQDGQATGLPSTDPSGPATVNWELEEALDVEWAHAIAPGAQIILVEANSQSLSDLIAAAATAAVQPGVSVVSMSWGFAEGHSVFAADEANYDPVFNVPGVTFLASTGDYGAADPEYPAFSRNVIAIGGTSLTLNADNSYNSETGWGYYSDAAGALIGSGGGISQYEVEPSYQQGVQSTGYRTTPDVSMVADPATGAWIADPYNLNPSDPFEVVGGTSLSAPAWAGLLALVNQGRVTAGEPVLNRSVDGSRRSDELAGPCWVPVRRPGFARGQRARGALADRTSCQPDPRLGPGGPGQGRGSTARRGSGWSGTPDPCRGRGHRGWRRDGADPDRSSRLRPPGRGTASHPTGRRRSDPIGLDLRRGVRRTGRQGDRMAGPGGGPRRSHRPTGGIASTRRGPAQAGGSPDPGRLLGASCPLPRRHESASREAA